MQTIFNTKFGIQIMYFNTELAKQTKPLPSLYHNQLRLATWILLRHWVLSRAKYSPRFKPIISLFTTASNINFGLPLPLVLLLPIIISFLLTTTLNLRHICPNHLSLLSYSLSSNWCNPYHVTNVSIPNHILHSLTAHPPQHFHLRYTHFSHMLFLSNPTSVSKSITGLRVVL